MSLTINLCTRGRPELMLDTVARTLPNIARDDTILMVSIDHDDAPTIKAAEQLPTDKRVLAIVSGREDSLGAKYNRALRFPAAVYLAMVDYGAHVTPGFDQKILDAAAVFPDRIGVVYNGWANLSFPTINAVTGRLAEKMGGIYPAWFPYWYVDHWLDDIARYIDRIAYADVEVDTSRRPGTQGMRDGVFWSTLFDALYLRRQEIAKSIIRDMDEPNWRKRLILARFPWVRQRSDMTNASTRATSAGASSPLTGDEATRYARIKLNAETLLRDLLPEIEAAEE